MRLLLRLFTLPAPRRRLLVRAGLGLMAAAWQVRRWPFARIASGLGPAQAVAPSGADTEAEPLSAAQCRQALDAAWAIDQWTRRWPWPPTCLMQALAARRLLLQAGVPCRLYFGVRGGMSSGAAPVSGVGAHAWLCCGSLIVTGAGEASQHRAIALYRAAAQATPK